MFKNKKLNMVLSLLIAVVLWAYVIYTTDPLQTKTFNNIQVSLENESELNERGLAVRDPGDITVSIRVQGKRQTMNNLSESDIHATVDVSECASGENVVKVDVKFDKNVTLAQDTTLTVHIYVEDLVTETRDVQVMYPEGMDETSVDAEIVSPETVEVSGAESTVAKVDHVAAVLTTDDITDEETEAKTELLAVDRSGYEVEGVAVSQGTATVRVSAMDSKTVPLVVDTTGNVASGYILEGVDAPTSVTLTGSKALLEDIDSITCEDIDISGLTGNTDVTLSLNLPEGVSVVENTDLTATVYVEEEDTVNQLTFDEGDIQIRNLGDGLAAEISDTSITVSSSSNISKSDITLSVNLSGLTAGTHTVKLRATGGDNQSLILSRSSVTVVITEE